MSDHNEHTRQGPLGKKLTGYRKEVPGGTWEGIHDRLSGRRRSDRPLVWLAAAAGIALAVTIGVMVADQTGGQGELARETGPPEERVGRKNKAGSDAAIAAGSDRETGRETGPGADGEGLSKESGGPVVEGGGPVAERAAPAAGGAGRIAEGKGPDGKVASPAAGRLAHTGENNENASRGGTDGETRVITETARQRLAAESRVNEKFPGQNDPGEDARLQQRVREAVDREIKNTLPGTVHDRRGRMALADSMAGTGRTLSGGKNDIPEGEPVTGSGSPRRWSMGGMLAPLYTYRDAPGSYASNQTVNSAESGRLAYAGGLKVSYRSSRRLSVESGLVYNRMGLTVSGLKHYTDARETTVGTDGGDWDNQVLTVSNSLGTIVSGGDDPVVNNYKEGDAQMDYHFLRPNSSLESTAGGTLQQTFEYLEVPLNVRYTVIDRTVDVQLVGGFSTNILVGSGVEVQDGAGLPLSGEVTEMQPVNVAGNAGIGVIYTILENLDLVVEPRVRYYLHSANSEGLPSTRPYTFGIYTGVNYAF